MVIHEDEALLLRAEKDYKDPKSNQTYKAGQTWMLKGPIDYIPDIEIKIVEKRKAYPLAENEGIYVRDLKQKGEQSLEVRLVKGP